MNFIKTVALSVLSSQPLIWVRTHEATEVRRELLMHFRPKNKPADFVFRWNILQGLVNWQDVPVELKDPGGVGKISGPDLGLVPSISLFLQEANKLTTDLKKAVVLLVDNFHYQQEDKMVLQALQDFVACDKKRACSIDLIAH